MAKGSNDIDKGAQAEEALREYFRGLGSLVFRGVPVKEGSETVTDIDLWVYTRTSSLSRHITIVDIKNKKRGKAFERAIWLKGLQAAVGANDAIIASNGAKDSAYSFASKLDLRVLSSNVFSAILKRYSGVERRLSCDDADALWRNLPLGRSNVLALIDEAKLQISRGITFAALNLWIDDAVKLLREILDREKALNGPLTRAFYLCCCMVAMAADYLGREFILSDPDTRKSHFWSGMVFGQEKEAEAKKYLDFAESVATDFLDPSGAAAAQIRTGFEKAARNLPVEGLVEFFSKANSGFELFKAAQALEDAAYSRSVSRPSELTGLEAKAVIGLICDFAGVRRAELLGNFELERRAVEKEAPQGTLPI